MKKAAFQMVLLREGGSSLLFACVSWYAAGRKYFMSVLLAFAGAARSSSGVFPVHSVACAGSYDVLFLDSRERSCSMDVSPSGGVIGLKTGVSSI